MTELNSGKLFIPFSTSIKEHRNSTVSTVLAIFSLTKRYVHKELPKKVTKKGLEERAALKTQ